METSPGAKPDTLRNTYRNEKPNFVFKRPPDAPVFYPTLEQFKDPLEYIGEISKEGIKYGLLKIIPPEGWKPPFALNYDNFKFKPRIQKINELEATTRIKLDFMSKVLKAVAQDGKVPKLPYVDKSLLDLHQLHFIVQREGGLESVNKRKKWADIAAEMGLNGKTICQTLRQHYETCLIPYLEAMRINMANKEEAESEAELIKLTNIRELKSLEFLGPGPKMPTCNYNFSSTMKTRTRHKKVQYEFDPLAKYMCQTCGRDDSEGVLAHCKTCFDKYHLVCLNPPLTEIPKDWLCPKCLVACDPNNPYDNYGFETAEKEYSLKQFGHMADKFKQNHFKVAGRLVSTDKCEEEYWKIMSCMDSSVTVEYGADLSVMDVGSGFPTQDNLKIDGCSLSTCKKYAESKWNLNNLSVLPQSALRHIVTNISGMKVPWAYVGMCFTTFCWHNEDHWSYSINYLHWGEPKTWYGVSGLDADKFEREIKSLVPELFEDNSNILHELVTTMNPNQLMERGVPIWRTDQKEGEFVVTFPRAYHAGFNQGFNFAEACNFAPSDWIPMGRKSVIYYAHFKRTCVFSHDELICSIAENSKDVYKDVRTAAFNDMKDMVFSEMNRRSHVKTVCGITNSERYNFSFPKDEDKQCKYCRTTCFLSGVYCPCSENTLVCLDHTNELCSCDPSNKVLRYHYTFSELVELLLKFIDFIKDSEALMNLMLAMYEYKEAKPFTLCKIVNEAANNCSTPVEYYQEFKKHVALTLRCSVISRFLVQSLIRKDFKENLSYESINFFFKCLKSLPWTIPELKSFEDLIKNIGKFQNYLSALLDNDTMSKPQLESCLQIIKLLNVSFNEVSMLEQKIDEKEYDSEKMYNRQNGHGNHVDDGDDDVDVENLVQKVEEWNNIVRPVFDYNEKVDYSKIVFLVSEGKKLKIDSTYMNKLKSLEEESTKWVQRSERLLSSECALYLHELDEYIKLGKSMPVSFINMPLVETEYVNIKNWQVSVRTNYCLKDSSETLLQILWPRKFKPRSEYVGVKTVEEPLLDSSTFPEDFGEDVLAEAIETEYKSLMTLRWENTLKRKLPFSNKKIKCVCNTDLGEQYLCCELCQTMYHHSCFPREQDFNKLFTMMPYKNPYCSYCIRTKRPPLSVLDMFLKLADKFKIKLPEYFILKYRVHTWTLMQNRITTFFNLRDVSYAYQKILNHQPKDFNDVPIVHLHDRRLLALKYLLQQIDCFEVSLNFSIKLWALYEATKSDLANRRRVSKVALLSKDSEKKKVACSNFDKNPVENKKSIEKKPIQRKRKNSHQKTTENGSKKPRNIPRKKPEEGITEDLPAPLRERFSEDQLRAYLNEEMCAALTCLKPAEEEVHWVQCDGKCRLWFHMKCVNVGVDEVKDDDDYICLKCLFIDEKNGNTIEHEDHNRIDLDLDAPVL